MHSRAGDSTLFSFYPPCIFIAAKRPLCLQKPYLSHLFLLIP